MSEECWRRTEEVFHAALGLATSERPAFVESACRGDERLREEVESLLAAHARPGEFLARPALERDQYLCTTLAGRYAVERELGRGGVGVVYLARDVQLLFKPVVVKVLLDQTVHGRNGEWFARKFAQEIEALARIDHPGVVGVLDAGETPDGRPFFVMQYVEGTSLRARTSPEGVPLSTAADLIRQIGGALTAAHEKGVLHRDLKPENVMLQDLGGGECHARLIDFGIARVEGSRQTSSTAADMLVGTVCYMAPEQLRQERLTSAVDVYALGAIAYELVTGRLPYLASTLVGLAELQRANRPAAPRVLRGDLPAEAEAAILRALSFEPADRFPRARDFADAFAGAIRSTSPVAASGAGPAPERAPEPLDTPAHAARLEPVGGAVPLDSAFYVVRGVDEEFRRAVHFGDSIVLVKGARQMGKTSLLARGIQQARRAGAKVVLTDLQTVNDESFASLDALFRALAEVMAEQLDLDMSPEDGWKPGRSPNRNFERFIRRSVLEAVEAPIVWGLDEVDRLFACPFGTEVFGLFRSWHNARSLDPDGPWRRLTLAIAYATEAHLFIRDVNQSPFNVGTQVTLADFGVEEVGELDRRHGSPLGSRNEVDRFMGLVGGHPYLVRRGLYELAARGRTLAELEALAERDDGPFADHLRRILVLLGQDAELRDVVKGVLGGRGCSSYEAFYRLRSSGLMAGDSMDEVRPRCRLYARYLEAHL